jgi:hypothetical protein
VMALANKALLPFTIPLASSSTDSSRFRSALIFEMVLLGLFFSAAKGMYPTIHH